MHENSEKESVKGYWEEQSCGEAYMGSDADPYEAVRKSRYELIPDLMGYANFPNARDKDVLEIGVGLGTDFANWLRNAPRTLTGIDLTERAVRHTLSHLNRTKLGTSNVKVLVADAEDLPFEDNSFDIVYSWGVLHHSPDTPRAINEVHRVLRPGGRACIMIYHSPSIVGIMLWIRYGLLKGKFNRSLRDTYASHLESPGTKAYSQKEARAMFSKFATAELHVELTHGDLLEGDVGQRHGSRVLRFVKKVWPRTLIRQFAGSLGSNLIITAYK